MCLILFSYKEHTNYKLIVAANRDEFYQRPTAPANFWENKEIVAGKDLEAGGTWMGMTKKGRLSMLTNYRDLTNIKENAPSRGHLVSDYLQNGSTPRNYLNAISAEGEKYNGFNLITGDHESLYYYGNHQEGVHQVQPGIHGLSNALLNSPWPKVEKGKEKLKRVISNAFTTQDIFDLLYDDVKAVDDKLPDTGVGYDKEKMLSPMFIKSENYGSRCSTIILVDMDDNVQYAERTYELRDFSYSEKAYEWKI